MSLDRNVTLRQLAGHAAYTQDGRVACGVASIAVATGVSAYVVLLLEADTKLGLAAKCLDASIFVTITTPLAYLWLAYFSSGDRPSRAKNMFILIAQAVVAFYLGHGACAHECGHG